MSLVGNRLLPPRSTQVWPQCFTNETILRTTQLPHRQFKTFDGPTSVKLRFPQKLFCLFKAFGRKLGVDFRIAVAVRPYRLFSPSLNHLQRIRPEIAFATEYAGGVCVGLPVLYFMTFAGHLILLKGLFDFQSDCLRSEHLVLASISRPNMFYMIQICGLEDA